MYQQLSSGLVLRSLEKHDASALAKYFDTLTVESKRRFQPHALTAEAALQICAEKDAATLRVIVEFAQRVIAYFILDPMVSIHEIARYRDAGITLKPGNDFMFAPSVLDEFQSTGIASMAMPYLTELARTKGARSLVLMGGTQATNHRAIAFYEKFGFVRYGGYQTDVFNHDMRRVI
jgi:diamine N-acetyltransferase